MAFTTVSDLYSFHIQDQDTDKMKKMAICLAIALLFGVLGGTAFADVNYTHTVSAPATATKGTAVTVKVHVEGKGGWHVITDYPTKLTITAPTGVKIEKAIQSNADAVKFDQAGADFNVVFTSAETGKKTFTGQFKFAIGNTTDAAPQTVPISFSVDVR